METELGRLRQTVQSAVGKVLPPRISLPLRARLGGSREPELSILSRFVHAGDTVIDVGAHHGVYTYHLARLVGPTGHVVAYEPQPALARYLSAGVAGPGWRDRVELRARALSDTAGTTVLHVPLDNGRPVIGRATLGDAVDDAVDVDVATAVLDDEPMPGPLRFMKVDVEGHELALLKGAQGLLTRDRPTLLVEVEVEHAGTERVRHLATLLLDDLGYQARELSGNVVVPVDRKRWDGPQLNRRPGGQYANNFLFTTA
ncbi:FkbM family methyltransferase [uncultured Jatrophihabitans sp.]|uniref:FkbM family methyltransferase n=1 Tax=uncultured Jatrophihabitans sp. TaxID=1610747 RepID=UPI0035CC36FA